MPRWAYVVGLVVLTSAGAAMRAAWLDGPMRYDESWTFLFYIAPRELAACLTYSAPNNHILHTLAVAAASWAGGDGPVVLRLPAYLAGVAMVSAVGMLATALSGQRVAGLVGAAMVAGSGILIEYSADARGYTMLCLAAVVLTWLTVRIVRDGRPWGRWIGWAAVSAAGLWVIPIMVYPMIALAAVIVLQAFLGPAPPVVRRRVVRRVGTMLLLAAAVAAVLYAPVVHYTGLSATEGSPAARASPVAVYGSGIYALVGNEFVAPRPLGEVAGKLPGVAAEAVGLWGYGMGWLWRFLMGVGVLVGVVVGFRRRRALWLMPVVLAVVLVVMTLAQRVVPFGRVWLFGLPMLAALAAAGWAELAGRVRRGRWRVAAGAVLVMAAAGTAAEAGWRCMQPANRVSLGACLPDARAIVADALELADGRTALAWDYEVPTWPPLVYYVVTQSSPGRQFYGYLEDDCRRVLVVVPAEQTLGEVLGHRPQLSAAYGDMRLWRRYPAAEVYIADRKAAAETWPSR